MNAVSHDTGPRRNNAKKIVLLLMTFAILVPAGLGFAEKLLQFFRTLSTDAEGRFTIVPISNYLLVGLGMGCLLVWAIFHGMFHDIEKPKFTMLEQEQKLDQATKELDRDHAA